MALRIESHATKTFVAVSPPIALRRLDEAVNFGFRQIAPGSAARPWHGASGNCSFFGGWRDQREMRFGHAIEESCTVNCSYNGPFANSVNSTRGGHIFGLSPLVRFPPSTRWWRGMMYRFWSCRVCNGEARTSYYLRLSHLHHLRPPKISPIKSSRWFCSPATAISAPWSRRCSVVASG